MELIPTMAAADAMLFKDRPKGLINSIALEKLAKKALGIFKAYRLCKVRSDWEQPASQKSWTSKVDEELWRRIDPAVAGIHELEVTYRKAEDEIRQEMNREASIAKARTKLSETKGNAQMLGTF